MLLNLLHSPCTVKALSFSEVILPSVHLLNMSLRQGTLTPVNVYIKSKTQIHTRFLFCSDCCMLTVISFVFSSEENDAKTEVKDEKGE